jgi:hypothetical protein
MLLLLLFVREPSEKLAVIRLACARILEFLARSGIFVRFPLAFQGRRDYDWW